MSLESLRNRALGTNPSATPTMKIHKIAPMNMSLGEIKEVIDANPDHPQAIELKRFYDEHSRFLSADTVVAVEKAVVLGILDGRTVTEKTTGISPDGREVIETVLEEDEG